LRCYFAAGFASILGTRKSSIEERNMSEAANRSGEHPLDHVVWNALSSTQRRFALGNDRALRFLGPIAPFAGIVNHDPASFEALRGLMQAQGPLALVTPTEVKPPAGFAVTRAAVLVQMVWQGELAPASAAQYVQLTARDVPEMVALATATQPGPFGTRTIELGDYYGMQSDGRLVAMAGERMRLDGFTEISAVCVDDGFRGKGYAANLVKWLVAAIRARAETPFLHVLSTNHAAIALYRRLGFVERREMFLTGLAPADA
jgi:predicted GNAT family acetyltransferase